jgi:hypothetical protein
MTNKPTWAVTEGVLRIYSGRVEVAAVHMDQFPQLIYDLASELRGIKQNANTET